MIAYLNAQSVNVSGGVGNETAFAVAVGLHDGDR